MSRQPRYELVTTDAGHHARFRGRNGRILRSTEVYTTKRRALDAIRLLARPHDAVLTQVGVRMLSEAAPTIGVREVDER